MGLKAVANLGSGGGGGGISGSGTAGYVAKFTGGTSIGNSLVRDNGTDVSIDMAPSVGFKLSVNGDTNIVGRIDATSSRISTMSSGLSNDLVLQRDGVEAARIIAGGLVGFGNTNPAATIEAYAAVTGEVRASGDLVSIVSSYSYNSVAAAFAPFVRLSRSRGTRAAPTAVNALDTIGVVQWQARGTTDRAVANISCTAPANAGGDQISGQLTFATAQTTDALPVVRLTIDPAGVASFAGPVRATGTTAAAPAFTGSDTDTGMYFPANNQVRFSTNGTLAVAVDASQNVGVGIASPVAPMHVYGASTTVAGTTTASNGILRVEGSATNKLFFGSFSDSAFGVYLQTNSTSYPIVLQPAGGNVGIGTANPASLLTVNGNIAFNSGFGSAAVAYGTRAWATINNTTGPTLTGGPFTVSRTAASTTATVTSTTAHGLITGNQVYATSGVATGLYVITVTGATTFTFTTVATTALSAVAITFATKTIFASGNVSSVGDSGTGTWIVNFINAMPDTNYAITGAAPWAGGPYLFAETGNAGARQVGSCVVITGTSAGTGVNVTPVNVVITR